MIRRNHRRRADKTPPHSDLGHQAETPGPGALRINSGSLELPGSVCASFAVAGYPREVGAGWLDPLLSYPGRLDVALHIDPVPALAASRQLRRQLARLEAAARAGAEAGKLTDPAADTAAQDAADLAASLARGQGRLFRAGLYLTVHAADLDELAVETDRVRALAASLLLAAEPTTFRALQGWVATLPLGCDPIGRQRLFDTASLAAAFPFTSPDLEPRLGACPVMIGLNASSSGVVLWDRFAQENANSVTLARSGAGKSYLTKLEIARLLCHHVQVSVIDPEDEYTPLADAMGATVIRLGTPGHHLNPFDLTPTTASAAKGGSGPPEDALIRRALFLQTLVASMSGTPLAPALRSALDRAVLAAYERAGITCDPATWHRPAPLLSDLADTLTAAADPASVQLADILHPYTAGSFRGLFAGPTTTAPTGHLIVWSLRDLPDEVRPVGMLLALDAVWQQVTDQQHRRRRLVVVDEAWTLMQHDDGARFLYRLAKSARKHRAGLAVISQDAADLLSSDLGKAVVANAATQILLRQAPQVIAELSRAWDLTEGERAFLLSAGVGEGLICGAPASTAATTRTAFTAIASETEHHLATTSPPFDNDAEDPQEDPQEDTEEDA